MLVIICVLLALFCGAIDCAGNAARWRKVKATGIPAEKYPFLTLVLPVVHPPNHVANLVGFAVGGLLIGLFFNVVLGA